MDWFIHEQNLAHYSKVLSETTNPTKRQILLRLLADERRKWNEIDASKDRLAGPRSDQPTLAPR